jgi:hypothetical protein
MRGFSEMVGASNVFKKHEKHKVTFKPQVYSCEEGAT